MPAFVASSRTASSQTMDVRISVGSVDEFDFTHEASFQWREYSECVISFTCSDQSANGSPRRSIAALISLIERSTAATELMCCASAVVAAPGRTLP